MYIHDGLSVVLSSYLLGVCTGIVAAIVMTLQTELYSHTTLHRIFAIIDSQKLHFNSHFQR